MFIRQWLYYCHGCNSWSYCMSHLFPFLCSSSIWGFLGHWEPRFTKKDQINPWILFDFYCIWIVFASYIHWFWVLFAFYLYRICIVFVWDGAAITGNLSQWGFLPRAHVLLTAQTQICWIFPFWFFVLLQVSLFCGNPVYLCLGSETKCTTKVYVCHNWLICGKFVMAW